MKRRAGRSGGNDSGSAAGTAIVNSRKYASGKLVSPLPLMSTPHRVSSSQLIYDTAQTSERYNFNLTLLRTPKPTMPAVSPNTAKTPNSTPRIQSVSDLRDLVSNRMDSLKKDMDQTHSAFFKEMEASSARLAKRLKLQTQSCMQHMDEADREWKKFSDRYNDDLEEIQATCTELITEAQSTGSRICKTSIPEMMRSVEKSLEGLRSRYGLC